MRLWHYKLIPYLPKQMLVSQWRECIAIKRQWEKGTLKHRLVSYVMNYNKSIFIAYVDRVINTMGARDVKYNSQYYLEIRDFCDKNHYLGGGDYPEHNDRYLKQCLYNLQEKFDRGIIKENEWNKIKERFNKYL